MIEELDQCRSLLATVDDADKKHRAITFRLNTDAIDDHFTVIEPRGVRLAYYDSVGRPVLWHHGLDVRRGVDPIAKNEWVKPQGNKRSVLVSRNQFFKDDFSQERFEWYQDEVLKGISLRFRQPNAGDYGPPTPDEIRARPELEALRSVWNETQGRRGWVLRAWDLAEQSCTPLPSNPETIAIPDIRSILDCCRSGMWLPDDVRTQLEALVTEPESTPEEKPDPVEGPHIVHEADAYRVMLGERCLRSVDDEATAQAYLATIADETDSRKTPEYLAFLSRSRHEAFEERMTRMINEYIEFRCYGALGSQ
jgi:hypothetical protein